jgi:hypothetical protein
MVGHVCEASALANAVTRSAMADRSIDRRDFVQSLTLAAGVAGLSPRVLSRRQQDLRVRADLAP